MTCDQPCPGTMPNCSGSAMDYKRHRNRGEEACQASKKAWRQRQRAVRQRLKGKGKNQ